MDQFEETIRYYFLSESTLNDSLYERNCWIPWISAVLGAFVVGLSGLVPLLIMPDNTARNTSQSHKDVTYVSPKSQPMDGQKILVRTFSRQQLQCTQVDVVKKEQTLNRYLSFAVGGLLGDICLHLLPEIYSVKVDSSIIHDNDQQIRLGISILVGILSFLAIEKLFEFTQVNSQPHISLYCTYLMFSIIMLIRFLTI